MAGVNGKRNGKLPPQLQKANQIRHEMQQENKAKFLQAFEAKAGNISAAAKAIGITRTQYHKWRSSDPAFAQACEDVKEGLIDLAETMLLAQMRQGNIAAIIFYLKTQGKGRGYVERTEISQPPQAYDLSKLTREERRQLYELTVKALPEGSQAEGQEEDLDG